MSIEHVLGKTFGRLTVTGSLRRGRKTLATCTCACGGSTVAEPNHLERGRRVSCGCTQGGDRHSPDWREKRAKRTGQGV